jgi:hypothetical protein
MKTHFIKSISINLAIALFFYFCTTFFFQKVLHSFHFTLESIYLFFSLFLIIITTTSHIVYQKNKDIVGLIYLFNTGVKLVLTYILFHSAIDSNNKNTVERLTLFAIFILFLSIETVSTIRLLNKKQ